ncbi:GA-binding protein subunit beta-2-like [Centruroides sculpturatus]|uniref:GA-binding protein subunit beta-2-like n=1 Tax=Centruroides sculpturatus TaxID=218467 RepID=UPI000C6E6E60|nr:GA-binding protein subunit beta-2-like [Centruroides sculpturatus]
MDENDINNVEHWIDMENDLTPIHIACWVGDVKGLKRCISKSKNINVKDKDGRTPLHLATTQGFFDIVDILLRNGADVNAMDHENHHPIFKAVEQGHFEVARRLIEAGTDLYIADNLGDTVLHSAIKSRNANLAFLLIRNMENTNFANYQGQTPLSLAESFNMEDIKEQLSSKETKNTILDNFLEMDKKEDSGTLNNIIDDNCQQQEEGTIDYSKSNFEKNKNLSSVYEEYSGSSAENDIKLLEFKEVTKLNSAMPKTDENASSIDSVFEDNANEISGMTDEITGLSNRLGPIRDALRQIQTLEDKYKRKIQVLQINLSREQTEKDEIEKRLQMLKNSIRSMQDEYKTVRASIQETQMEIDAIQKKLTEEKEAYENLSKFNEKLKDCEEELVLRINNIEQELDEIKIEKSSINSDNNYLRTQINILKTEVKNRIKEEDEWEKKLSSINNERQNSEKQIKLLDRDIKFNQRSLEDNIKRFENKLQMLASEKDSLDKKFKQEIRRRSSAEKEIALEQQELQELNGKYNQIKRQISQIQKTVEEQSRFHCNTEKILRDKIEHLRSDNYNLYQSVNNLRLSLQHTESEFEKEHLQSNQVIADLREDIQNKKFKGYRNDVESMVDVSNETHSVKNTENMSENLKISGPHERINKKNFFYYLKSKTKSEECKKTVDTESDF